MYMLPQTIRLHVCLVHDGLKICNQNSFFFDSRLELKVTFIKIKNLLLKCFFETVYESEKLNNWDYTAITLQTWLVL
jgi:mevalonate pyrophosphate decarboxylase